MHPNVDAAFDAAEHDGIHYLVMEYVDGRDLASVVKERGPLEIKQALDCVLQAAKGLAYAHTEGVIHRDIKPGNLLLDKNGTVKILDMGLARVALAAGSEGQGDERLTQSGQVMGTCDYMAPEQAEDTRKADQRSDIYSLGCTLYRLLTGKAPYSGESLVQILLGHQNAPIPALRTVRPDVPERVEAIFQKMMAKRPEERYQSMGEVIVDVEEFLGSSTRPPVAGLVQESPAEVLPQSLAFLQEAAPVAAATNQ
jgi:serine/threonine protein kinase